MSEITTVPFLLGIYTEELSCDYGLTRECRKSRMIMNNTVGTTALRSGGKLETSLISTRPASGQRAIGYTLLTSTYK